jgi:2-amino-4-ketopentanoate thiolase alpha subunit
VSDTRRARPGDWVEVERTILDPSQRSKNLPPETAEKPLLMWVKGFALADGALGEEMTVETMTGRRVSGTLSAVNPGYYHTFGDPIPELVHVGRDLRDQLAAYRAASTGGPRTEKGDA